MADMDEDTIGYLIAEAALTAVEIASGVPRTRLANSVDRAHRVVAARSAACLSIRHVTGWSAERIARHIGVTDGCVKYHLGLAGVNKVMARANGAAAASALAEPDAAAVCAAWDAGQTTSDIASRYGYVEPAVSRIVADHVAAKARARRTAAAS